jgi:hypothetical protein
MQGETVNCVQPWARVLECAIAGSVHSSCEGCSHSNEVLGARLVDVNVLLLAATGINNLPALFAGGFRVSRRGVP